MDTPAAVETPPAPTGDFKVDAGDVFSAPSAPSAPESAPVTPEPATTVTPTTSDTTPVAPAAPAAPAPLTAEAIAKAVKEGMTPAAPQKELTPEELDKMFKVYKATPEILGRLQNGGDDAVAAFHEIRDGLLAQFDTITAHRLAALEEKLLGRLSPALQLANSQAAAKEKETFFTAYPNLKEHEKIVDMVYKLMVSEGANFQSVEEARKALADRASALLPGSAGGQPTPGAQQTQTPKPPEKKPASLSTGSQAGGGAGGGSSATPNVFQEVFG